MTIHSLGAFDFISIEQSGIRGGAPEVPQQTAAVVQRPGVDGTGIILLGSKGQPVQMLSVRDVGSIALGNDLAVAYRAADRTEAWELVFQGINYYTAYGVKYFVLHVDQITIARLSGSRGGVMGSGAGALVRAVWTVIPIVIPEEE